MNKSIVFILVILIAPFVQVRAEAGPPSVSFPTGDAAWNIDYTYHNQASATQVNPVRIEVVRTGEISHYHITWSNQKTTDDWLNAKYGITTNPNSGVTLCSPRGGEFGLKYPARDQSTFSWVSTSQLVGPTTYEGISCLQVKKGSMQAWIDETTHRPVAMDDGSAISVYTFPPPPIPKAVMPKEYQDYLVRYEQALAPPQAWGNVRQPPP